MRDSERRINSYHNKIFLCIVDGKPGFYADFSFRCEQHITVYGNSHYI